LPNVKCATTVNNGTGAQATLPTCIAEVTASPTPWSRRTSNSIQYWSSVMSGLQVKLQTAIANYQSPASATTATQPGTQIPKMLSGSVVWARGPLSLGAGYESHEGFRQGTSATAVANPKDTAFALSGKWSFGPGQVGLILENLAYANIAAPGATDNGVKQQNLMLNGSWRVGPGAVWASRSSTPGGKSCTAGAGGVLGCGSDGKATMISLGYDYIMSKRTKMYVGYAKIDNSAPSSTSSGTAYYYIAGPNANGGAGGAALTASTDVTTIAVGLQHTF
jgi:predicted porin